MTLSHDDAIRGRWMIVMLEACLRHDRVWVGRRWLLPNKTTLEGQNRPAPRAANPGACCRGAPVRAGLRRTGPPGSARGACHASKFSYKPPLARFG